MIPIRDDAPRSAHPYVTYFLIALNLLLFLFEVSLDPQNRTVLLYQFGVVPSEVTAHVNAATSLPILSSMFLHASWLHVIANMWALWIFGDNIEEYLGSFRYLLLYLLSGVGASLLHIALNPHSNIPSVGASGAIAGVMGAYFLLFPTARVLTVVPIVFMFVWLPAWLVLGYWFLAQFVSGAATSITSNSNMGGVAFWAHVGGFIAGLTLIKLFPPRQRPYSYGQ